MSKRKILIGIDKMYRRFSKKVTKRSHKGKYSIDWRTLFFRTNPKKVLKEGSQKGYQRSHKGKYSPSIREHYSF
jgi:hypothetical protein